MFLHENALNTQAFPSLAEIQSEVVGACARSVARARRRGRLHDLGRHREHPVGGQGRARTRRANAASPRPRWSSPRARTPRSTRPRTTSASACTRCRSRADFARRRRRDGRGRERQHRARRRLGAAVPAGRDRPDPRARRARGDGRRVDARRRVHGRVRAAVHGAARRDVPPWDFRVDGVTTISADVHKLGYAPKGASVILHRTKELRRYQTFVFDDWLGGFYASPNMQGTRSGLPMATAWAVMHHLGIDGYRRSRERRSTPPAASSRASAPSTGLTRARRARGARLLAHRPTRRRDRRVRARRRLAASRAGSSTARRRPTRCTRRSARQRAGHRRVPRRPRVRAPTGAPRRRAPTTAAPLRDAE